MRVVIAVALVIGTVTSARADTCEGLEDAHEAAPSPESLTQLAECYEANGKLASAWTAYRELAGRDPDPTRRQDALARAQPLGERLPRLLMRIAGPRPDDLVVKLNGLDVTALIDVDTPIDLGTHDLLARAEGFQDFTRQFLISREGAIAELDIALVRPGVTTVVPVSTAPPLDPVSPGGNTNRRAKWGVACVVTGVAFLGSGVYFAITADKDVNRGIGIAGIGTGAVLGGAGVYLLKGTF
jgi:hypothetical protein